MERRKYPARMLEDQTCLHNHGKWDEQGDEGGLQEDPGGDWVEDPSD